MTTVEEPVEADTRPAGPAATASPWLRRGAVALLVGGPLSMLFHVLYGIGHGPTVVNEHGVVLGLTNDQWSYLGGIWMALVGVGVVMTGSLHNGRLSTAATRLVLAGLVLSAVAAWVWVLYSIGAVLLYAGVLCLAVTVLRGRVLPRWSAFGLLVAVASFLPLTITPDEVVRPSSSPLGFEVEGEDVIAFLSAAGWTTLGLGLLTAARRAASEA